MRRLEASDRAIRQALDYLIEIGWVMKNPGYGHPLRPEYILVDDHEAIGLQALEVWDALGAWRERDLALERWPLLICQAISQGASRFGKIRTQIPEISPRALALALKRVEDAGLARRTVREGRPPVVDYEPTNWGKELALLLV